MTGETEGTYILFPCWLRVYMVVEACDTRDFYVNFEIPAITFLVKFCDELIYTEMQFVHTFLTVTPLVALKRNIVLFSVLSLLLGTEGLCYC